MQDLRRRKFKVTEMIEGRNAVLEAFRSGKCVDKLFILDGCQDGPVRTIAREARKHDTIVKFVPKERLDSMSETGAHQGVPSEVHVMSAHRTPSQAAEFSANAEKNGFGVIIAAAGKADRKSVV